MLNVSKSQAVNSAKPDQAPSGKSPLSAIGPAILLTATSVGAGDILTGSLAGAQAGMAVLWAVPAGVLLKWTLTEGIARWQMATGTTLLEGWVRGWESGFNGSFSAICCCSRW